MIYTIMYPIITSDYSAIWQHELLYDPRHAVPANNNARCFLGFLDSATILLCPAVFSWRKGRRRTRYHEVFPTILLFAIHHEWRGSVLLQQQRQFHQLCFLDISRTQLFWNYCSLDLAGALVKQFSLLRIILKKRNPHSNWCECALLLCSRFSNVLNTPVYARVVPLTHSLK